MPRSTSLKIRSAYNMFHRLKDIVGKFVGRSRALIFYIWDYKIIFISIVYIVFDFLILKSLRNIPLGYIIGVIIITFCLLVVLIAMRISQKYNENFHKKEEGVKGCGIKLYKYVIIILIIAMAALFCLLRCLIYISEEREYAENIKSFTNENGQFWAYLTTEPLEKRDKSYLEFEILGDGRYPNLELGKILVRTSTYPKLKIGQVCFISGKFVEPENFDDFDYKTYLKNKNVYLILENAKLDCISIQKVREGNVIVNALIDFKDACVKIVDENLNEPQSSLLAGIIFGQRRAFSEEFELATRISGVSHIVAASGYNVTVLVLAVNKLFFFLGKRARICLSILLVWAFCIVSGLSASIIRASIMSTVALVAVLFGRNNSIHISLPLAAFLFVIINPVIVFDVGFQLSIMATLGLIYLSPGLELLCEIIIKKKPRGLLKEYVITTLACTLSTLPISIFTFQTFSLWSVLANTLILPVVESTMLWGFLGVIATVLNPVIGRFFFLITHVQLKYFELVVYAIKNLEVGFYEIDNGVASLVSVLIGLGLIVFCIYFYPIGNEERNHYLKIFD